MKTISITQAQNGLRNFINEGEPLLLTDGSQPLAVLVHVPGTAAQLESGMQQVSVVPLTTLLGDTSLRASIGDDAVCVIAIRANENATHGNRDWWGTLQTIDAQQRQRGFVGTVAEIDRDDQDDEQRIAEIYKRTAPKTGSA